MSDTLYMIEMEQLLERVSEIACSFDKDCSCGLCLPIREQLEEIRKDTINTFIHHFGLSPEDAESEVAAACGEEP